MNILCHFALTFRLMVSNRTQSGVLTFFTIRSQDSQEVAECTISTAKIKSGKPGCLEKQMSTSPLWDHLKAKHNDAYSEADEHRETEKAKKAKRDDDEKNNSPVDDIRLRLRFRQPKGDIRSGSGSGQNLPSGRFILRMARKWHRKNGTVIKWHKNGTCAKNGMKMARTKWRNK